VDLAVYVHVLCFCTLWDLSSYLFNIMNLVLVRLSKKLGKCSNCSSVMYNKNEAHVVKFWVALQLLESAAESGPGIYTHMPVSQQA
jgi:hypothetical protein